MVKSDKALRTQRLRWRWAKDRWFGTLDDPECVYFVLFEEFEHGSMAGHSQLTYIGEDGEQVDEFVWGGEKPARRRARAVMNEWEGEK